MNFGKNFKTLDKLPVTRKYKRFGEGGFRKSKNKIQKKPLFSLITVVLNNEKFLEKTIQSVLNQKIKNFEYIIIDGGSSDSSLKIIKKYEKKISYWVSEKDMGLYDAFNKGLILASGDIVGIINSDDTYTPECLKIVDDYFQKNQKEKHL